ncbi:MAG: MlaD family protein, partial [Verrucomicrobiales bacterium]
DGTVFNLYESQRSVEEVILKPRLSYLLMFSDSVRGLSENAPVEFRGIRVGSVTGISFEYAPVDPLRRVPVLIRIDPSAMGDAPGLTSEQGRGLIERRVEQGLRATLKTGSILTGQLFVDLRIDPDGAPAEIGQIGQYRTLPTVSSGLARLEDKLVQVLKKINDLPVEDTLDGATEALAEIKAAAKTLNDATGEVESLLASDGIQNLPARIDEAMLDLKKTMAGFQPESLLYRDLTAAAQELGDSLRSIRVLADSIERKPNSVIFGKRRGRVEPPTAKPR